MVKSETERRSCGGLKNTDSPILKGYHNFVRPHMDLDGKTPAEVAGIKVEGNDKWKTLIQNASRTLCKRD